MSRELARKRRQTIVGRKSSPDRLLKIIKCVAEMPVIADVCRRSGCSRTGLEYWIAKSEAGEPGDGFDVATGDLDEHGKPIKQRFHELFAVAVKDGIDSAEKAAWKLVHGQPEVLTHKGHVQYKINPAADALGLLPDDPSFYLRDVNGDPIPETILKQDPDMIRFMLKAHRPDVYVATQKHDVRHSGGVLVVGVRAKSSAEFDATVPNKLADIQDVEFEEIDSEAE
jgi:hypothetical protein